MKGIVFTEFLDLVGKDLGDEVVDRIIEESNLPSGAAYTSVGTYDHGELITMTEKLAEIMQVPAPDLLRDFGKHLFTRFAVRYAHFFCGIKSSFEFLTCVEAHIHVEVRKLYPDAELPSIDCKLLPGGALALIYRSTRPFAPFAEGLMLGAIAHYGEAVDVIRTDCSEDGRYVRFELRKS